LGLQPKRAAPRGAFLRGAGGTLCAWIAHGVRPAPPYPVGEERVGREGIALEEIGVLVLRWAVPAACAALAAWAAAQLRRAKEEDRAVRLGLQALLRDRLYWNY